jgi:O-methyltransferase
MLRNLFKRGTAAPAAQMFDPSALLQVQGNAPVDANLRVLLGGLKFGGLDYYDLYVNSMQETGTGMTNANVFHRALAGINLASYFLHSLGIDGARAECGVYRGASALMLSRIARTVVPGFDGSNYHLVDSFEGFSHSTRQDHILLPDGAGGTKLGPAFPAGDIGNSVDGVRSALHEFPAVTIHKGWIPDVLAGLPETKWSFAYLDVDIYEPTLAGLEYFYPRMSTGGVIITDDFDALMCPGVREAWEEYCVPNGIPYIVLDTHQAVIIRQ